MVYFASGGSSERITFSSVGFFSSVGLFASAGLIASAGFFRLCRFHRLCGFHRLRRFLLLRRPLRLCRFHRLCGFHLLHSFHRLRRVSCLCRLLRLCRLLWDHRPREAVRQPQKEAGREGAPKQGLRIGILPGLSCWRRHTTRLRSKATVANEKPAAKRPSRRDKTRMRLLIFQVLRHFANRPSEASSLSRFFAEGHLGLLGDSLVASPGKIK